MTVSEGGEDGGSRVLPRNVLETWRWSVQVGPLAAFKSVKVFEVTRLNPVRFDRSVHARNVAIGRHYIDRSGGRFTACMPAVPPTNICHVIYEPGITLCPIYYILCYVDGLAILSNRSSQQSGHVVHMNTKCVWRSSHPFDYVYVNPSIQQKHRVRSLPASGFKPLPFPIPIEQTDHFV